MATLSSAEMLRNFERQMADQARGEKLRKLREARRLSQEDAAHEIGVTSKSLRTWEHGGPIKWENAKLAGKFYAVNPEELVSRETVDVVDESSAGAIMPYRAEDIARAERMEAKLDMLLEERGLEWLEPERITPGSTADLAVDDAGVSGSEPASGTRRPKKKRAA